jgi:hypothetical protein
MTSLQWMSRSAVLYISLVIEARRNVTYGGVIGILDSCDWRLSGEVTEQEFFTLLHEWLNPVITSLSLDTNKSSTSTLLVSNQKDNTTAPTMKSIQIKRKAATPTRSQIKADEQVRQRSLEHGGGNADSPLGLNDFRNMLLQRGVSSERLNQLIILTSREWDMRALHTPLRYLPPASSRAGAGSKPAILEEITERWLSLANDLFLLLDPRRGGLWSYDELLYFCACIEAAAVGNETAQSNFSLDSLGPRALTLMTSMGAVVTITESGATTKPAHGAKHRAFVANDVPASRNTILNITDGVCSPTNKSSLLTNKADSERGILSNVAQIQANLAAAASDATSRSVTCTMLKRWLLSKGAGETQLIALNAHVTRVCTLLERGSAHDITPGGTWGEYQSVYSSMQRPLISRSSDNTDSVENNSQEESVQADEKEAQVDPEGCPYPCLWAHAIRSGTGIEATGLPSLETRFNGLFTESDKLAADVTDNATLDSASTDVNIRAATPSTAQYDRACFLLADATRLLPATVRCFAPRNPRDSAEAAKIALRSLSSSTKQSLVTSRLSTGSNKITSFPKDPESIYARELAQTCRRLYISQKKGFSLCVAKTEGSLTVLSTSSDSNAPEASHLIKDPVWLMYLGVLTEYKTLQLLMCEALWEVGASLRTVYRDPINAVTSQELVTVSHTLFEPAGDVAKQLHYALHPSAKSMKTMKSSREIRTEKEAVRKAEETEKAQQASIQARKSSLDKQTSKNLLPSTLKTTIADLKFDDTVNNEPLWESAVELKKKLEIKKKAKQSVDLIAAELGGVPMPPMAKRNALIPDDPSIAEISQDLRRSNNDPLIVKISQKEKSSNSDIIKPIPKLPVKAYFPSIEDETDSENDNTGLKQWVAPPREYFTESEDEYQHGEWKTNDSVSSFSWSSSGSSSECEDEESEKHHHKHIRPGKYKVLVPAYIREAPGSQTAVKEIDPGDEIILTGYRESPSTDPDVDFGKVDPDGWVRMIHPTLGPVVECLEPERIVLNPELAEGLKRHPLHEHKKHKHQHKQKMSSIFIQAAKIASAKDAKVRKEQKQKRRFSAIIREAASKGATVAHETNKRNKVKKRLSLVLQDIAEVATSKEVSTYLEIKAEVTREAPAIPEPEPTSASSLSHIFQQSTEQDGDEESPPPPPSSSIFTAEQSFALSALITASSKKYTGSTPISTPIQEKQTKIKDHSRPRSDSAVSALTDKSIDYQTRGPYANRGFQVKSELTIDSNNSNKTSRQASSVDELATTPGKGRDHGVRANLLRNVLRGLREKDMADLGTEDLRQLVEQSQSIEDDMMDEQRSIGSHAHSVFSEQPLKPHTLIQPRKKELLLDHGRYSPDKSDAMFAPNSPEIKRKSTKGTTKPTQPERPAWTKHFVSKKL